jgi:hypothetical protein
VTVARPLLFSGRVFFKVLLFYLTFSRKRNFLMSPLALLPFVEKFPDVSVEERALLLDFARTASLHYGAWKPFKKLFKQAEADVEQWQSR